VCPNGKKTTFVSFKITQYLVSIAETADGLQKMKQKMVSQQTTF
jgi:hypothetical protein